MKPLGFFGNTFAFTHGIRAADHDGVGVVDDAVADGVSQRGFADFLVPAANFEL